MQTLVATTLIHVSCSQCGIPFGIPSTFREELIRHRRTFYCPNGHTRWYPGRTVEQERDAALGLLESSNAKVQQLSAQNRRLADDVLDHAKTLKSLRARATAGLCLKCNRTFQNVKRHNATKHRK